MTCPILTIEMVRWPSWNTPVMSGEMRMLALRGGGYDWVLGGHMSFACWGIELPSPQRNLGKATF